LFVALNTLVGDLLLAVCAHLSDLVRRDRRHLMEKIDPPAVALSSRRESTGFADLLGWQIFAKIANVRAKGLPRASPHGIDEASRGIFVGSYTKLSASSGSPRGRRTPDQQEFCKKYKNASKRSGALTPEPATTSFKTARRSRRLNATLSIGLFRGHRQTGQETMKTALRRARSTGRTNRFEPKTVFDP